MVSGRISVAAQAAESQGQTLFLSSHNADSSTSWLHGRYATKVPSLEKEPGLKQVIPVYLNAFCLLLSPKTICASKQKDDYTDLQTISAVNHFQE